MCCLIYCLWNLPKYITYAEILTHVHDHIQQFYGNCWTLCVLHKSHIWENFCSWDMGQNVLSQSDCRIFESINDFLHVDTRSHKLKVDQNIFGWTWWKMGMVSLVMISLDSEIDFISRMSRWNEQIFCMLVQIQESQKLFKLFLGGYGKKWVGHLVHETLKSAVSGEWVYECWL